jgi:integration host factor subunit beta
MREISDGDPKELNPKSDLFRPRGSIFVKKHEGYTGRNPKTGEKVKVTRKKLPFFTVGKELKDRMNG